MRGSLQQFQTAADIDDVSNIPGLAAAKDIYDVVKAGIGMRTRAQGDHSAAVSKPGSYAMLAVALCVSVHKDAYYAR